MTDKTAIILKKIVSLILYEWELCKRIEEVNRLKTYLIVDTSSDALTLALAQRKHDSQIITLLEERHLILANQHGVSLLPNIQELLSDYALEAEEVTDLWVGRGPGSYTGLRIGMTLAKMWAQVHPIELRTVSSLALMAAQIQTDGWIVPVVDARRMTAYTNIYHWNDAGQLEAVLEDRHTDWEDWCHVLGRLAKQAHISQVMFVGKDIQSFVQLFGEHVSHVTSQWVSTKGAYPQASAALLVEDLALVTDVHTLAPNYAHATLAERQWAEKHHSSIANEEEHEKFIEHFSGH